MKVKNSAWPLKSFNVFKKILAACHGTSSFKCLQVITDNLKTTVIN